MRGGALPLLAWATLLIVLMVLNWIWTGDAIQVGTFAFAVAVVLGIGLVRADNKVSNLQSAQAGPSSAVTAALLGGNGPSAMAVPPYPT